jgi:hypothetical protein
VPSERILLFGPIWSVVRLPLASYEAGLVRHRLLAGGRMEYDLFAVARGSRQLGGGGKVSGY